MIEFGIMIFLILAGLALCMFGASKMESGK